MNETCDRCGPAVRALYRVGNPLETVIEAHGGLERWRQLDVVSAHLVQSGALRALKGHQGVLATHSQRDLNGASPWES
jgi:hypothetical protein